MAFKKKLEIREHGAPIYSVDGFGFTIFTTSGDRFVIRWNLQEGKQDHFAVKMQNTSFKLKYYNGTLFIGSNKGELYVIDVDSKEIKFQQRITDKAIYSLLANDDYLIAGNTDGDLLFLDRSDYSILKTLKYLEAGKIRNLIFIDDDKLGMATRDGYIRIINWNTDELVNSFFAHEEGANKMLVQGDIMYTGGKDGRLNRWNWKEEKLLDTWPIHYTTIYDIQIVGEHLVTASRDKSIKIWNYSDGLKLEQKFTPHLHGHVHSVNALYVVDDKNFCSVGDDRRIIWWSWEE